MNMTGEQIKQALDCCVKQSNCSDCSLYGEHSAKCLETACINALDYINHLESENEKLVGKFVEKVIFEIVNKPSEFTAERATPDFLSGSAHRQNEIIDIIEKMAGKSK